MNSTLHDAIHQVNILIAIKNPSFRRPGYLAPAA